NDWGPLNACDTVDGHCAPGVAPTMDSIRNWLNNGWSATSNNRGQTNHYSGTCALGECASATDALVQGLSNVHVADASLLRYQLRAHPVLTVMALASEVAERVLPSGASPPAFPSSPPPPLAPRTSIFFDFSVAPASWTTGPTVEAGTAPWTFNAPAWVVLSRFTFDPNDPFPYESPLVLKYDGSDCPYGIDAVDFTFSASGTRFGTEPGILSIDGTQWTGRDAELDTASVKLGGVPMLQFRYMRVTGRTSSVDGGALVRAVTVFCQNQSPPPSPPHPPLPPYPPPAPPSPPRPPTAPPTSITFDFSVPVQGWSTRFGSGSSSFEPFAWVRVSGDAGSFGPSEGPAGPDSYYWRSATFYYEDYILEYDGSFCGAGVASVDFSYHMYGPEAWQISIDADGEQKWLKDGSQGRGWFRATGITLNAPSFGFKYFNAGTTQIAVGVGAITLHCQIPSPPITSPHPPPSPRPLPPSTFSPPPPVSTSPPPSVTCEDVLGVDAGGFTCGARISYLVSSLGFTQQAARQQVATEYPSQCGPCAGG
ncbi:MAG: hypothetical protein SGPRY_013389, partial [Prymnesium sp.]